MGVRSSSTVTKERGAWVSIPSTTRVVLPSASSETMARTTTVPIASTLSRRMPTELTLFTDAGLAWTAEDAPVVKWARTSSSRIPVVSARMNVFGSLIFEVFYAVPFQRPDKGGFVGVNLLPGW